MHPAVASELSHSHNHDDQDGFVGDYHHHQEVPATTTKRRTGVRFEDDAVLPQPLGSTSSSAEDSDGFSFEDIEGEGEDEGDREYAAGVERDVHSWAGALPATQGLVSPTSVACRRRRSRTDNEGAFSTAA